MNDIAYTIKTKGWEEIKGILLEEVRLEKRKINPVQGDREIATQFLGKLEAEKIVDRVIRHVERLGQEPEDKTTSYK